MSPTNVPTGPPNAPQDVVLMQRAQNGDPHAFKALWKRHEQQITALCIHLMRPCHADGKAAAVEASEQAWIKIGAYKFTGSISGWLCVLAKNHCLQILRSEQARVENERHLILVGHSDALVTADAVSTPADIVLNQIWLDLNPRMAQLLTKNQRIICRLAYQQHMTSREVAETLEMNASTVRSILRDTIKPAIIQMMEELEVPFPAAMQGHVLAKAIKEKK